MGVRVSLFFCVFYRLLSVTVCHLVCVGCKNTLVVKNWLNFFVVFRNNSKSDKELLEADECGRTWLMFMARYGTLKIEMTCDIFFFFIFYGCLHVLACAFLFYLVRYECTKPLLHVLKRDGNANLKLNQVNEFGKTCCCCLVVDVTVTMSHCRPCDCIISLMLAVVVVSACSLCILFACVQMIHITLQVKVLSST